MTRFFVSTVGFALVAAAGAACAPSDSPVRSPRVQGDDASTVEPDAPTDPEATPNAVPTEPDTLTEPDPPADASSEPVAAAEQPTEPAPPPEPAVPATGGPHDGKDCTEDTKKHDMCGGPRPVGAFDFGAPIAFDVPVTLPLDPPTDMPRRRWKRERKKLAWKRLSEELGLRNMHGGSRMGLAHEGSDWAVHEDFETRPTWWWATPETPVLLIPHTMRVNLEGSVATVYGLTVARQVDGVWMASTLHLVPAKQVGWGGNVERETGLEMRYDGVELLSLSQIIDFSGESPEVIESAGRHACRIRWMKGALRQACTHEWSTWEREEDD